MRQVGGKEWLICTPLKFAAWGNMAETVGSRDAMSRLSWQLRAAKSSMRPDKKK